MHFKILHAIPEKEYEFNLEGTNIYKMVQRVGDSYFNCTLLNVFNITGGMNVEIIELRNVETHKVRGNNYLIIQELINNSKALQKKIKSKKIYKRS